MADTKINEVFTKTYTVKDIYGKSLGEVVFLLGRDYLPAEFRIPVEGEDYLGTGGEVHTYKPYDDLDTPRLIVRKKEKKRFLIGEWEIVGSADGWRHAGKISNETADNYASKLSHYRIEEREV